MKCWIGVQGCFLVFVHSFAWFLVVCLRCFSGALNMVFKEKDAY